MQELSGCVRCSGRFIESTSLQMHSRDLSDIFIARDEGRCKWYFTADFLALNCDAGCNIWHIFTLSMSELISEESSSLHAAYS